MSKLKNFLIGLSLSLNKVENEALASNSSNETDNILNEDRIKEKQIKVISNKNFYDLLEKADENEKKIKESTKELYKKRKELTDVIESFKNERYGDFFEGLNQEEDVTYLFVTSNDLCKYANSMYIKKIKKELEFCFLIDLCEHPKIKGNFNLFNDLNYFEVPKNGTIYSYHIHKYTGFKYLNEYELLLKFRGTVNKNAESEIHEDKEIILLQSDFPNRTDAINFPNL